MCYFVAECIELIVCVQFTSVLLRLDGATRCKSFIASRLRQGWSDSRVLHALVWVPFSAANYSARAELCSTACVVYGNVLSVFVFCDGSDHVLHVNASFCVEFSVTVTNCHAPRQQFTVWHSPKISTVYGCGYTMIYYAEIGTAVRTEKRTSIYMVLLGMLCRYW